MKLRSWATISYWLANKIQACYVELLSHSRSRWRSAFLLEAMINCVTSFLSVIYFIPIIIFFSFDCGMFFQQKLWCMRYIKREKSRETRIKWMENKQTMEGQNPKPKAQTNKWFIASWVYIKSGICKHINSHIPKVFPIFMGWLPEAEERLLADTALNVAEGLLLTDSHTHRLKSTFIFTIIMPQRS